MASVLSVSELSFFLGSLFLKESADPVEGRFKRSSYWDPRRDVAGQPAKDGSPKDHINLRILIWYMVYGIEYMVFGIYSI